MNKEIKWNLLFRKDIEVTVYTDGTVWIQRYEKTFKNLKSATFFLKQKSLRQRHKKLNRRKRNKAKLCAKKWCKLFNEIFNEDNEEKKIDG